MKNKICIILFKNISYILTIFFITNYNAISLITPIWSLFNQKIDNWLVTPKSITIDYIGHLIVILIIACIITKMIFEIKEIRKQKY